MIYFFTGFIYAAMVFISGGLQALVSLGSGTGVYCSFLLISFCYGLSSFFGKARKACSRLILLRWAFSFLAFYLACFTEKINNREFETRIPLHKRMTVPRTVILIYGAIAKR